jgi:hypothetical protein
MLVVEFRSTSRFSSLVSIAVASSLQDGIGLRTSKYKPIHLSGVPERWIFSPSNMTMASSSSSSTAEALVSLLLIKTSLINYHVS